MNQIFLSFLTGLTSGGVSCLAVQGGLLASAVNPDSKYKDTSYFLIAKIISYTLLGGMFGYLGSVFTFSLKFQGLLQILIGLFMIATAGRLLDLHPIFRFTVLKPPTFILRKLKNISNSKNSLTSIILGILTVFIPCGVTQAMLILAMGSGNALMGALIMLAFTLGTSPIFFVLGVTVSSIFKSNILTKIAAVVITFIGLSSINNGQILRASPHTFQNYKAVIFGSNSSSLKEARIVNGIQEVEIVATNSGYTTNTKTIKANIPVKLRVVSKNVVSCARSFIIPSLNVNKLLPSNGVEVIEFTPKELGELTFSCGMGMYTGSFTVIK